MNTIQDAWDVFVDLHGGEEPPWTLDQLRDAIHARGWRYEELTRERLGELYDEELAALAATWPIGHSRDYVADRRQYLSDGRRSRTSGGWAIVRWDGARRIWIEPAAYYQTKREALEVLRYGDGPTRG
jgi:hypothetical protein